jgi:uncharacterized protein (DUF1501 family)
LGILAGVAVHTGGLLRGATLQHRALVCIRLADGADAEGMLDAQGARVVTSAISRDRFGLNGSLAGVQRLFEQRSAAFVEDPAEEDREYLMNGYTAPGWMMRAAGASISDSEGRAFPFASGLLLLSPDGLSVDTAADQGGDSTFPDTGIGRQLRQVAGLLASKGDARLMFVATLGGSVTVGDAATQRDARLRQLDEALVAFQNSLDAKGASRNVVTFTDADGRHTGRRLVAGGSVIGGEVYTMAGGNQSSAVLAAWAGYQAPGAVESADQFLF